MNSTERTIKLVKIEALKEAVEALESLAGFRRRTATVTAQREIFGIRASIDHINEEIEVRQGELEEDNDR
jgi:hypothetical protein